MKMFHSFVSLPEGNIANYSQKLDLTMEHGDLKGKSWWDYNGM
jgi:hypothetical protein